MLLKCNWCLKEFKVDEVVIKDDEEYCPFCGKAGYLADLDIIETLMQKKIILKDLTLDEKEEVTRLIYKELMKILGLDKDVIEFKLEDFKETFSDINFTSNEDFIKIILEDILNEIKKDIFTKIGIDF
ncbi:hypothetical protein [Cetobacterium sp.]|uniref:hypothetical protein n=1 Tax=Cetobacterium sp. TaxID=2071632 RepID=UPI003F3274E0